MDARLDEWKLGMLCFKKGEVGQKMDANQNEWY